MKKDETGLTFSELNSMLDHLETATDGHSYSFWVSYIRRRIAGFRNHAVEPNTPQQ
ncbi:MAG: hypothetical protein ACRDQU_01080 [Pseudonocardiaceae bacterium]